MPSKSRWAKMTPEQKAAQRDRVSKWRQRSTPAQKASKYRKDRQRILENPVPQLISQTKHRAKKLGIPFDLTADDIFIPEYCPVLGLKLERGKGKILPNSPSIDRIIPALGYVRGNVIIISNKANAIKQNATPDEIIRVGEFFKRLIQEQMTTA